MDRLEDIRAILDFTTPDKRQSFPKSLKVDCEILSKYVDYCCHWVRIYVVPSVLEEIAQNLTNLKDRNFGHKFLTHDIIARALEGATARINAALQQFNVRDLHTCLSVRTSM